MADRWTLLVGIDTFQEPSLGALAYAEDGTKAIAAALTAAGYPKDRQHLLLGSRATKAVIESRVRKLRKVARKGDEILVWISSHAFSRHGAGVVAGWDALPDDLIDTGVPVAELVKELMASKASQVVFLLDIARGSLPAGAQPADVQPTLDGEELHALFADTPKAVCLTAAVGDDESHRSVALRSSAWASVINDALSGRAGKAVTADGVVTAWSLQRHIEDELPRVLRKQFEGRVTQSPCLFGEQNATTVVADLSAVVGSDGGGLLDPERLKRVTFRSESPGKVKDLSGFRKTYKLPDHAGPSSRKFVAKCAVDDVRADVNSLLETVREHMGYKRKDVDTAVGSDGFGSLRTPDFEYTVSVSLDPADPTRVIWRREVGQFGDIGFVRGSEFEEVFGQSFDQLVFDFVTPVDVTELVDRLEDAPADGLKVRVDSDASACEVTLAGFVGGVRVDRRSLTVRGRGGQATGLLDQFLAFVSRVGPIGVPLGLPAKT